MNISTDQKYRVIFDKKWEVEIQANFSSSDNDFENLIPVNIDVETTGVMRYSLPARTD